MSIPSKYPVPTPAEDHAATVAGVRSTILKGAGSP
jgi:hypothetical protein